MGGWGSVLSLWRPQDQERPQRVAELQWASYRNTRLRWAASGSKSDVFPPGWNSLVRGKG